jgi:predicted nucleic acid-binding protein
MIIIDTSVWIDFFSGKQTKDSLLLKNAINNSEDLCICGVILTEVLQGIRNEKEFKKVYQILNDLIYYPENKSTFLLAVEIYRSMRKKGKTIRKPIDCIIAATCIENSAFILHCDRDFEYISENFPLQRYMG